MRKLLKYSLFCTLFIFCSAALFAETGSGYEKESFDSEESIPLERNHGVSVGKYVEVHQGPGSDYPVLARLEYGETVMPLRQDKAESFHLGKADYDHGHWYKIRYKENEIGYVFSVEEPVPNFSGDFVINDNRVNIRKGPGLDHPVVTQLNRGDMIIPLEKEKQDQIGEWNDYWYKIQLPGEDTGYVYGPFISFQFEDKITDGNAVTFNSEESCDPVGLALYETYRKNHDTMRVFALEAESYYSQNINDFLEQNDVFPKLYREIIEEMEAVIRAYENKQGVDLELSLSISRSNSVDTKGIQVIEMKTKTIVLYDLDYLKSVVLGEGPSQEVTRVSSSGVYAVYPDGTYIALSSGASDVYSYEVNPRDDDLCAYKELDMVTDIDGDDNPELWYSDVGYESSTSYISFLTEDSKRSSGILYESWWGY
ncbi:MAG: SH3 domain-containing protein [Spirochaetaceae bacterium]